MRTIAVLSLLLFGVLLFASCSKEKEPCVAILNLRFDERAEEVEWMEVNSGRQDRFGDIQINAWGYNDERFSLTLRNITDTGIIIHLTPSQISFSDGIGFHSQQVQSGFIRIVERNQKSLSGIFEIFLADNTVAAKPVKAVGSFRIFGHD